MGSNGRQDIVGTEQAEVGRMGNLLRRATGDHHIHVQGIGVGNEVYVDAVS